jgi:nitroreductase
MTKTNVEQMLSRQSVAVRKLGAPGPNTSDVETILQSALTAPDHGGLRPWRVIVIGTDAREGLAALFIAAKRKSQAELNDVEIQRERDKAIRPPVLFAFLARTRADRPGITEAEQLATAGAAMQNMLVAAHLMGFGAIILSGQRCEDADIRAALGIAPTEHFLGFISIGSILEPPIGSRRPVLADVVTRLERL